HMLVFVLDAHSIYRRGLLACLASLDGVESVADAETVEDAWENAALVEADVVLVDQDVPGASEFIRTLRERTGASVLICSSHCSQHELVTAVQAGALGYLCKETLTPEVLASGIRTAAAGAGVIAPEMLGDLLRIVARASQELLEPRGLSLSRLTARELEV